MLTANSIDVHDGLISDELVNALFESIHQPVYKFGQKSNVGDEFGFWIATIDDQTRNNMPALRALWEIVDKEIANGSCDIERMYVNAYTYGDCPTVHLDDSREGSFTVLYYANYEWNHNWSGEMTLPTRVRVPCKMRVNSALCCLPTSAGSWSRRIERT